MRPVFKTFDYCVFDFETTGFNPKNGDEPIEIGAIRIEEGEFCGTYQSFISPDSTIPANVQSLTGITPEDVEDAPSSRTVLEEFMSFADEAILVAHNLEFDMKFLKHYYDGQVKNKTLDTLRMSRKLLPTTKNSLDHLVEWYNLKREKGHRALDDAKATAKLLEILFEKVKGYDDYCRSGFPKRLIKEDLSLILNNVPIDRDITQDLSKKFNTLSEVLDKSPGKLSEKLNTSNDRCNKILTVLRDYRDDPEAEIVPPCTLFTSYKMRYWSSLNYVLNILGSSLIVASLFTIRFKMFITFLFLSLPFFLSSPIISWFRNADYAVTKQITGSLILIFLWGLALYLTGYEAIVIESITNVINDGINF